MKPSFNLWKNILSEYVSPKREIEFTAQLARLFTSFGHQWEPEQQSSREKEVTEQERARHAIIRAEIQSGWSDEERQKRSDGDELASRLKSLELAILRDEKDRERVRCKSVKKQPEVCQLVIGYND